MKDIYQAVLPFTDLWNNTSSEEIEIWLKDHEIEFPKHEIKKRKTAKEKRKNLELFALKDLYLGKKKFFHLLWIVLCNHHRIDNLAYNIERSYYD